MTTTPLMILVAAPYRSGTSDEPARIAATMRAMNEAALALPLIETAGSTAIGDAVFAQIFDPIAERIRRRCGACLRIGGSSKGADEMVRIAREMGQRVFYRLEDVPRCG